MARRDYPQIYKNYERGSQAEMQLNGALSAIRKASLSKGKFGQDFDEHVSLLVCAVESAWKTTILDRFFKTVDSQPKAVVSFVQRLRIDTPENILAAYSHVVDTDVQGRVVSSIYELLDEIIGPIQQAVEARRTHAASHRYT